MQASPPTIEHLKSRLIACLDEDNNITDATNLMTYLDLIEQTPVNKEALESTRLGLIINDLRKKYHQSQPELSKKCRSIIKVWQKLVLGGVGGLNTGDSSSATSSPASVVSGMGLPGLSITPKSVYSKLTATGRISSSPGLVQPTDRNVSTPKLLPLSSSFKKSVINGHHNNNIKGISNNNLSPGLQNVAPDEVTIRTRVDRVKENYIPADSSSAASSTVNTTIASDTISSQAVSPLKIRIKMGGSTAETAAIVKSVSVPNFRKKFDDNIDNSHSSLFKNGCPTVVESKQEDEKDEPVPAATSDQSSSSTSTAVKKVRQKRAQHDAGNATDSSDPLAMISRGLPLPKLKSTADLVAEMASAYPEEMAKSMASAAASALSTAQRDDEQFGSQTPSSCLLDSRRPVDRPYVSKSELVAQYLKSTSTTNVVHHDVEDGEQVVKASSTTAAAASRPTVKAFDQSVSQEPPKKRGRKRVIKIEPAPPVLGDTVESTEQSPQQTPTVRRKVADWYSILPPLDSSDDGCTSATSKKFYKSYLDEPGSVEDGHGTVSLYPVGDERVRNLHSRVLVTLHGEKERNDVDDSAAISTTQQRPTGTNNTSDDSKFNNSSSNVKNDPVVALPYVDIGLPVFLEYNYPRERRHFAHWSER